MILVQAMIALMMDGRARILVREIMDEQASILEMTDETLHLLRMQHDLLPE
jgi:hypothetical protein